MTWIVGIAPPLGFAILVSDICVARTARDGQKHYADCLQKIYPLGSFLLGGFAGSVKTGFRIIEALQREFKKAPNGSAWNVDMISNTWLPRVIRREFRTAAQPEQALGSSIILASAHPTRNRGDAPWPWTDVHVFSHPNFTPQKAGTLEVVAIGKGAGVRTYMDALTATCSDFSFMQAAVGGISSQAMVLAHRISRVVASGPIPGVSEFFQMGLIKRGESAIANHEYTVSNPDGTQVNHRFPPVARSWAEFERLCKRSSCEAREAVC